MLSDASKVAACRDTESMEMGVEVVSQEPRIFVIEDVISAVEGQLIIDLATKKLKRSRAGPLTFCLKIWLNRGSP